MKCLFVLSLLLLTSASYAQIVGKKSKDAIIIFDSIVVNPGDTLHFGNGTDPKGDFVYVYTPPNYWVGTKEEGMQRRFAHKFAVIKHFKKHKDKRTGEKTVAVINPFGGLNFVADVESAIESKEIVAINRRSFDKKEAPIVANVVVKQETSLADELGKLKKLHDEGVLTKEEFEAQKKKLLEKQ